MWLTGPSGNTRTRERLKWQRIISSSHDAAGCGHCCAEQSFGKQAYREWKYWALLNCAEHLSGLVDVEGIRKYVCIHVALFGE